MKEFRPAKKRAEVSVGESVRILRELQGLSQNQLAELSGVPQATLSAIGKRPGSPRCRARQGTRTCAPMSSGGAGIPRLGSARCNRGLTRRSSGRADSAFQLGGRWCGAPLNLIVGRQDRVSRTSDSLQALMVRADDEPELMGSPHADTVACAGRADHRRIK